MICAGSVKFKVNVKGESTFKVLDVAKRSEGPKGTPVPPLTVTAWVPVEAVPRLSGVPVRTTVPVPEDPTLKETDTVADAPGTNVPSVAGLGLPTAVTTPVRELVRLNPFTFVVQSFFTMNLVEPVLFGDLVTEVGLAVIVTLGHAIANSGRTSVGEGSRPEQASAAGSSRESIVRGRIGASFNFHLRWENNCRRGRRAGDRTT
jgi:hypothetical protein